ncbi:hypothetical protein ACLBX9_26330 [Methylobacterium sp. A49B]
MSDYIPKGYISIRHACTMAMKIWYSTELAEYEKSLKSLAERLQSEINPGSTHNDLIEVQFNKLKIDLDLRELRPIWEKTIGRFRDKLFDEEIKAFYFPDQVRSENPYYISKAEWASRSAEDILYHGQYSNAIHHIGTATVLVERRALNRVLLPASQEGHPRATRGPRPVQLQRVIREMEAWNPERLRSLKQVAMAEEFKASRGTCSKARDAVLSEHTTKEW